MKRLKGLVPGLATLLLPLHPALAQESEITAADVVDRETLKAFILAAKEYAENNASSISEYQELLQEFRTEGRWKQGSIYLFLLDSEGNFVFHGDDPELEGQNLFDLEDANGVKFVQELIAAAAEGGGYVEYLWPDPLVEGDEESGSPKVSYAIPYSAFGLEFVLGSGFYPETAATAVEGGSWGGLKSRF